MTLIAIELDVSGWICSGVDNYSMGIIVYPGGSDRNYGRIGKSRYLKA